MAKKKSGEKKSGEKRVTAKERALRWLDFDLEYAEGRLTEWAEKFNRDPHYALQWSDGAFADAAKRFVWSEARAFVIQCDGDFKDGVEQFIGIARTRMTQGARYYSHSTSEPSNICKLQETAAWAEILEKFEGLLERIEGGA